MPATVSHIYSATTPENAANGEIGPNAWNSSHAMTLAPSGAEILPAFSNDPAHNITFTTNGAGRVVADAPAALNVTGANGSSVVPTTLAFGNANGMTLGVSTAAAGATVTGSFTVPTVTNSSMSFSDQNTSGTLARLAATNLNGVTLSFSTGAGGSHTLVGSHNALTSQSGQAFSAQGGSSAFQTLSFSNVNGATFSNNAGQVQLSYTVPTVTNSSWTISDNATSLTISRLAFTQSNGMTLSLSTAAGAATVIGSYTVPTVPAQLSVGQSNIGNTSGDTGLFTGRLVLAGGNNITLSGSSNAGSYTITISGPNAGGAQTGISGVQVSDTTYTSGTVSFRNANGASFGSSGAQGISLSYTVPTLTSWTVSDNATSATVGRLAFTQSNGITMSLSTSNNGNHTVIASYTVPTVPAQLSVGQSNIGNTSGDTGLFTGRLVIAGGNNITVSGSSNAGSYTITISGANVGGAQTGISGIQVSDTTYTSGTVSFRNANGASFGSSGANGISLSYTVPALTSWTVSDNATSATVGRLAFTQSNGLTLSLSTSNNGNHTVIGSYTVPTVTNSSWTVSDNATSLTISRLAFTQSNGLTLSLSTGAGAATVIGSYTVPTQSAQTVGVYGSSQTTGSASSGTHDARSISFIGAGIISIGNHSTSVGGTTTGVVISATQSNQAFSAAGGASNFQTLSFGDTNQVSWTNTNGSVGIASIKLSMFAVSNTTQSSNGTANHTALSFAGAGIASVGITGGTVVVSVPSGGGVGDGGVFAGVSNLGNTAGSTGTVSTGNLVFVGSNMISLSQSTGAAGSAATITINATQSNQTIGFYATGNTTNNSSTTFDARTAGTWNALGAMTLGFSNGSVQVSAPATSSLVGSSNISISTNGSTITIGQVLQSYYENVPVWQGSTTLTGLQSTSNVVPFYVDNPVSFGFIRIPMTASMAASSTGVTTGNSQFSYGHTRSHNFVIYSRGVGASSLSLQYVASTQLTDQQSINVSANANSTQFSYTNRVTYYTEGGTTSFNYDYSSSAASLNFHTSGMTAITGQKMMAFPWATSLSAGMYWLMYGVSSSTASQYTAQGSRLFNAFSNYGVSQANVAFGPIGANTNSSIAVQFGLGSFTTNGTTTASVAISGISSLAGHMKMAFQFANIA